MVLFLGTLLIVLACCLALAVGLLLGGTPLRGGCGRGLPDGTRCAGCHRRKTGRSSQRP